MEASADLSIITLVAHASAVVQIVLAILLIFSLVSWTIIFQKWFQMSRARREARNFDKRFWGGADLNKLYESATERRSSIGPQEGIFYSGMTEFLRSRASNLEARAGTFGVIDGVSRAMRARYQRELDILESGLSVLATIGSVSPYIGLFGTVWGIMDAFTGLGNLESRFAGCRRPGYCRSSGSNRDRPVCRYSCRYRLQPLCLQSGSSLEPVRKLHAGIPEHFGSSGLRTQHGT